jgi:ribosomal protein S18 acetylase RimI-like enzyme
VPLPLRRATPADASALAALSSATFRDTYAATHAAASLERYVARHLSPAAWDALLRDGSVTWLAHVGEVPVAYTQVGPAPLPAGVSADAARPWEVRRLYVRSDVQGGGHGRRLLDAATATAGAAGADLVWLGVWEHNARAIAFYRRLGLAEIGEMPFDFDGVLERDLVLARPVTPAAGSTPIG